MLRQRVCRLTQAKNSQGRRRSCPLQAIAQKMQTPDNLLAYAGADASLKLDREVILNGGPTEEEYIEAKVDEFVGRGMDVAMEQKFAEQMVSQRNAGPVDTKFAAIERPIISPTVDSCLHCWLAHWFRVEPTFVV